MITIVAKNCIEKNKKNDFLSLAKELVEKSRKEEGCISYNLYESADALTFIEEWKDEASIELHNNSEHYKRIVPMLGAFRKENKEIDLYKKLSI